MHEPEEWLRNIIPIPFQECSNIQRLENVLFLFKKCIVYLHLRASVTKQYM